MFKKEEVIKKENEILKKEGEILEELKKEDTEIKGLKKNQNLFNILFIVVLVGFLGGLGYWKISSDRIYIEKSEISGTEISLSPQTNGILFENFVKDGDIVGENAPIARIGNELIKSKVGGMIISSRDDVGTVFNRGQAVAKMIPLETLRVVGRVEEDKGLRDISVGQSAIFTVDTFKGKEYFGVVDEISPTSREGDIVFNISGKREVREFNVKIRFDLEKYPELKNGMSAEVWVYKR